MEDGLRSRNLGEEKYLAPLWNIVNTEKCSGVLREGYITTGTETQWRLKRLNIKRETMILMTVKSNLYVLMKRI